jgi:hypothetical protein
MKIELNERQLKAIKRALYIAAQYEEGISDSYRVGSKFVRGRIIKIVPEEYRQEVDEARQNMKYFVAVLNALKMKGKKRKKKCLLTSNDS